MFRGPFFSGHGVHLYMFIFTPYIGHYIESFYCIYCTIVHLSLSSGVPRRQPHHHLGLANLPFVGAVP